MQILDSEAVGSRQSNEFGRFLCDVISREFNARAIVEELFRWVSGLEELSSLVESNPVSTPVVSR